MKVKSESEVAQSLKQHIKKQRRYFGKKSPSSQGYGFSSGHVFGCESWTVKKAER